MRIPVLVISTIATVLAAAPARAQTYSPDYPVCLHAFGEKAGYIECGYTSLAQCALSRRPVHHQSIFCQRASACGTALPAASERQLNAASSPDMYGSVLSHNRVSLGLLPASAASGRA